jgi:hypothetical protein
LGARNESIPTLQTAPHAISIDRRAVDLLRVRWNLFPVTDIFASSTDVTIQMGMDAAKDTVRQLHALYQCKTLSHLPNSQPSIIAEGGNR